MSICLTCGKWASFPLDHTCHPLWEVQWDVSSDLDREPKWEEHSTVRGMDAEDAAETWAEDTDRDGADYTIVSGTDVRVRVRLEGSDEPWSVFIVSGESVPTYSARGVTS